MIPMSQCSSDEDNIRGLDHIPGDMGIPVPLTEVIMMHHRPINNKSLIMNHSIPWNLHIDIISPTKIFMFNCSDINSAKSEVTLIFFFYRLQNQSIHTLTFGISAILIFKNIVQASFRLDRCLKKQGWIGNIL